MYVMGDNLGGMFDVSDKSDTLRLASAQATIKITPLTAKLIKEGKTPKGNIFDAARVAATLAAKRTSDLIPYCHTIPIDDVKIHFSFNENANAIETIKVVEKQGGSKNLLHGDARGRFTAAVLVSSDSRGYKEDKSGKVIVNKLKENGFKIIEYKVVADDTNVIESSLKKFCDELRVNLVLTTGGTGVGPRDNTPEATKKVIQKELAGVGETLRCFGQRRVPSSMLSRGVSGVREKTVIVNLPGSVRAVSQSLNSIFPGLLHAFDMLEGKKH